MKAVATCLHRGLQASAGTLLEATDHTGDINKYCGLLNYFQPFSSCTLYLSTLGYFTVSPGESLRVSWTCICGVGNAPTVDPITGACTPCPAGAKPVKTTGRGSGASRNRVQQAGRCGVPGAWLGKR